MSYHQITPEERYTLATLEDKLHRCHARALHGSWGGGNYDVAPEVRAFAGGEEEASPD